MNAHKSDTLHIGMVGLGPRGVQSWLPLLHTFPQCRVVAVCDRRATLLEAALAANPDRGIKGYSDYEAMLSHPGLDAVIINTDATTQADLAVQAMEAGKHVTTEVPACGTLEDCWKLVLATEQTGRIYLLAEQARYWGFIQVWKELVTEGQLGKVLYVEGEYVGFYGDQLYFQDDETGKMFTAAEARGNPRAAKTWRHIMNPITYLPHTLSPLLSVLTDRVAEVTAMGTRPSSYFFENIDQSDIEVALMKTDKDTILRTMVGFTSPSATRGETHNHFFQVRGTRGAVEWKRAGWDKPKMWLHDRQMEDWTAMSWNVDVEDASPEAKASGHGGSDYYPVAAWLDAIRSGITPEFDVYAAVETAAPAAAAIESIRRGSTLVKVPDFRPNAKRAAGQEPTTRGFAS